MSHPSIFELARFVERGHDSDDFEQHVHACDVCAAKVGQLAQRVMVTRGLSSEAVVPRPPVPTLVPVMALLACVAMLVSAPTRAAQRSVPPSMTEAPSDLHGTPWPPSAVDEPFISPSAGDAGPGVHAD